MVEEEDWVERVQCNENKAQRDAFLYQVEDKEIRVFTTHSLY